MTWKRTMMILMIMMMMMMMMTINQRELVRKAAEGEKGQPETEVAVLINLAFPSTKCLFFHFSIICFCSPKSGNVADLFFQFTKVVTYYTIQPCLPRPHLIADMGREKTIMSRSMIIKVNDMRKIDFILHKQAYNSNLELQSPTNIFIILNLIDSSHF